jgi:hypothetical protein
MHAALRDVISRAEKPELAASINKGEDGKGLRGVRTHDQEWAALVIMVAWMLVHGNQPAKRDVIFWRGVDAYLQEAGGNAEKRGRRSKQEDEVDPIIYKPSAEQLPNGRWSAVITKSGAHDGSTSLVGSFETYSEAFRVAKTEAGRMNDVLADQARLAEPVKWVEDYVLLAQRRALGPEADSIVEIFISEGMPAVQPGKVVSNDHERQQCLYLARENPFVTRHIRLLEELLKERGQRDVTSLRFIVRARRARQFCEQFGFLGRFEVCLPGR